MDSFSLKKIDVALVIIKSIEICIQCRSINQLECSYTFKLCELIRIVDYM